MRIFIALVLALLLGASSISSQTQHPRLWIKSGDVTRLRANATDSNPMWKALKISASEVKRLIDTGKLEDSGSAGYEENFSEQVSVLFAFMALVSPTETERKEYATRAKTVLMRAINEAAKGVSESAKFRHPEFSTSDRSRWAGAGWGLTVDWIYTSFSSAELQVIRKVFTRWATEALSMQAYPCSQGEGACFPEGMDSSTLDPKLLEGRGVRWAQNNYFAAHMRNALLMTLALDNLDSSLKNLQNQAIGRHLYAMQHTLNTVNAGGLGAEGLEYSPQTLGYLAQTLLALETAGVQSPSVTRWDASAFWKNLLPAVLHSSAPKSNLYEGESVYQAAWYGDGQQNFLPDMIESFGAMAARGADTNFENGLRWVLQNLAPGGASRLENRARGDDSRFHQAILYYLAFDPKSKITDPRANIPLEFAALGMGKVFSRSTWDTNSSWFNSQCSWSSIDHMGGDTGALEFYKKGEWLLKRRVGYGFGWVASDNQNTASYESTMPDRDDYRLLFAQRHSQWNLSSGDPVHTYQLEKDFIYSNCDMAERYNSQRENVNGMKHASRSVIYLEPDVVFVFDRARTDSALGKRITYNLPASSASINGNTANISSSNKQNWKIQVLVGNNPSTNAAANQDYDYPPDKTNAARGEGKYTQIVINQGKVATSRILTVLNTSQTEAKRIPSSDPNWIAALSGNTLVIFNNSENPRETNFKLETNASKAIFTGLTPNASYGISSNGSSLAIRDTGNLKASSAGVLVWTK
jgi:hypothetical protein